MPGSAPASTTSSSRPSSRTARSRRPTSTSSAAAFPTASFGRIASVEESYRGLADRHRLAIAAPRDVEPLTPILTKGGEVDPVIEGELPGGWEGTLGRLSYRGSDGDGSTWRFNLVHLRVPEAQAIVPRLFCIRRGRWTDNVHYGLEIRHADLWTESVALNERFKVQTGLFQDPNWMRQLFSPSFIDWLTSTEPSDFSFELAYGDLVGSIEDDEPDERTLTALCEATAFVAERIRDECRE